MKVMFPNDDAIEKQGELNDISGIVHDISNIEDSSFVMHLDSMNTRLGGANNKAARQQFQNTCKFLSRD